MLSRHAPIPCANVCSGMRFFPSMTTGLLAAALLLAQAPPAETPAAEFKGTPPRTGPGDYQSQAKLGMFSIGADFDGHGVPTPEQTLSVEDFVVVEVGLFGPPNAKLTLSRDDFSLRMKGKKAPLPAEPFELSFSSLKDPEWVPPEQPSESKSKGGLTTGGGGGGGDAPPPLPPKMPFNLVRAMQLHVQKAVLPQGDRPLPQAGLLFFRYHGKTEKIGSLELVYSGPAGKATLPLQP